MISFGVTLGGIIAGTFIPIYLAIFLIYIFAAGKRAETTLRHIAALGLGIILFFFVDVTLDSTELGVNSGFSGGLVQAGLLVSFAAGAIVLSIGEFYFLSSHAKPASPPPGTPSSTKPRGYLLFAIPALVAIGLGLHGAGEGSSFAFVASNTTSTSIIEAFGGIFPLVSYVLHKFLEATIVGSAYFAYVLSAREDSIETGAHRSFSRNDRIWEMLTLGLLMGLPSALGSAMGYYISIDPIYFYAFASGASIYAVSKLAEPVFQNGWKASEYRSSTLRIAISVLLVMGFLLLYLSALFHSVG